MRCLRLYPHLTTTQSKQLCRYGFSLVELVMVITVIGLLAGIALPRFSNSVARQRAQTAAKRIAADLSLARQRAIYTSAGQTVTFSGATYSLTGMQDLDHSTAAYKVNLAKAPYEAEVVSVDFGGDTEVVFDIYGMADSNGSVVVRVAHWQHTVQLEAETGQITLE